jgi:hypothetical protein
MNWILLAVVGVALLCPITMFGPMLLERLGLRKRSSSAASCMGMSYDSQTESMHERLRAKRAELDREIAVLEGRTSRMGSELGIAEGPGND